MTRPRARRRRAAPSAAPWRWAGNWSSTRSGWLGRRRYGRLLGDWLSIEAEHARRALPTPRPWRTCSPAMMRRYTSPGNLSRFRRQLDFVRPGDRVVDIGLGRGFQAGLLLAGRDLAAYHGIDLVPGNVAATRDMLVANGLAGSHVTVTQGDLYDLTRSELERRGADLLLCCEVLEHVPDPETALRVLADALPAGCDLLVSLPLRGRLEGVWGHLTVFDAARVRAMVSAADLHLHVVEPLHNTWMLLLLSRSPEASARAAAALARSPLVPAAPTEEHRDFHPLDLSRATVVAGRGHLSPRTAVHADRGVLVVDVTDSRRVRSGPLNRLARAWETWVAPALAVPLRPFPGPSGRLSRAGVELPVNGLWGGRWELAIEEGQGLRSLVVEGRSARGRCVSWVWRPPRASIGAGWRTLELPREYTGPWHHGGGFTLASRTDPGAATAARLLVALEGGGSVRLRLRRAAYLA